MLRDHNVARVVAARFISRAGGEAAFFVGVWAKAAYDLDATPGQLALMMLTIGLASMAGSAVAGVLVDRYDPKRVLLAGECLFVPAILALTFGDSMAGLAMLAPGAWFFGAIVYTAVTSFPPYLVADPKAVERTNVSVEAAGTAAFVIGPAVGALIVRFYAVDWVFVFDAATSLAAVGLVAGVRIRAVQKADRSGGFNELRLGVRYSLSRPPIRLVLVLGMMVFASFGAFGALEPLFYRDVLGAEPEMLGWVNSLFGVGLVAGTGLLRLTSERLVWVRVAVVGTTLSGFGALVYTGTDDLRVVIAGAMYWSVVLGVVLPLTRTLLHRFSDEAYIGRVMGSYMIVHNIGELLPLAFVPFLAAQFGVQRVLVVNGLLLVVLAPFLWPAARRIDASTPHEQQPPTTLEILEGLDQPKEPVTPTA